MARRMGTPEKRTTKWMWPAYARVNPRRRPAGDLPSRLRLSNPLILVPAGDFRRCAHSYFPGRVARRSAWARRWPSERRARETSSGGRRGAGPASVPAHVGGPGERTDPDRECAAGVHGHAWPRCACWSARAACWPKDRVRRRPLARRILGPCSRGCVRLADTARLLKLRGKAMQAAVPVGQGAMAALLGADIAKSKVAEAAAEGDVCRSPTTTIPRRSSCRATSGARVRSSWPTMAQARGPAAGLRALPLPADAACRRRDGRGAGDGEIRHAVVPL